MSVVVRAATALAFAVLLMGGHARPVVTAPHAPIAHVLDGVGDSPVMPE